MGINDKIAFAKAGYKFPDQPECPAILTATSSIRMPIGSDRGVMAHKLFESLPKGFVIFFSKLEVTRVPHRGDLQACYQVGLFGGKFRLTHTVETPPHGLAQIPGPSTLLAEGRATHTPYARHLGHRWGPTALEAL